MQDKEILKKSKNIVSRQIGAETILLPICKDTSETNCIYTLNKDAARVWELIDGKRPVGKIKQTILKEFSVTPKELEKLVGPLFKDLKKIKAIS
jgi:hypothetical protein